MLAQLSLPPIIAGIKITIQFFRSRAFPDNEGVLVVGDGHIHFAGEQFIISAGHRN